MKNNYLIYILITFAILFIIICFSLLNSKAKNTYKPNDKIKISYQEKIKIDDLEIKLLSITDSTCPKDVYCFWEGEYQYTLLINNEKVLLGTIRTRDATYKDYKLELLDDCSSRYISFKVSKIK